MRRPTIAVTGTRGVLGALVVRRLERDPHVRRVVLLDLVPPDRDRAKSVFHRLDLAEEAAGARLEEVIARERPDVLVHLAFLQHPTRSAAYARELEGNGTARLLGVLRRLGAAAPALLLRSTTLAYGARPENPALLREDAPLAARRDDPLAAAAIEAERRAAAVRAETGLRVAVLRFAPLLGGGHRTLAGRYLSLPAVPTILGFNPLVQALDPDDAAEAVRLAAARLERGGGVWNVAAPGTVPLLAAIRAAGRRSVPLPGFAAEAILDGLFQAGLALAPGSTADHLRFSCVADPARAAEELGFRARSSTRDCVRAFARGEMLAAA